MNDKIVPSNLSAVAPLLKEVYQEALTQQLNRESILYGRLKSEWTPEQLERIANAKAERERERKELLDLLATATGTVKAIVELHSVDGKYDECKGCDFGGYEGDMPSWPCRTIELIAEELRG